ncbi:hypothetical protein B5F76_08980 [Desulfovibrio sp. An276]|uniref:hypothetical protein n=1 Tax=Desulfovibrio sp. An276 TaxID=1965618 RepID=UPI000B373BA6|nr:hypothetical protein [Desulfovibrio sp. An276]OUO51606.1 hypothetical protein B5F76_08980 [Desulfovibrio sp. An276]
MTEDSNKQTELKLLEEKILVLAKKLAALDLRRAELLSKTPGDTGSRKSPRAMLKRKTRERLILTGKSV